MSGAVNTTVVGSWGMLLNPCPLVFRNADQSETFVASVGPPSVGTIGASDGSDDEVIPCQHESAVWPQTKPLLSAPLPALDRWHESD